MARFHFIVFACFLSTHLLFAQSAKTRVLINGGVAPGTADTATTTASSKLGGFGGIRLEVPLRTKFVVVAPEFFFQQANKSVKYKDAQGIVQGIQSGTLKTNYFGLSLPLQINLVGKNGNGVRFSGGVFSDFAAAGAFQGENSSNLKLAFKDAAQRFDFGYMGTIQLLLFQHLNLQMGYRQGTQQIQYLQGSGVAPSSSLKNSGFHSV